MFFGGLTLNLVITTFYENPSYFIVGQRISTSVNDYFLYIKYNLDLLVGMKSRFILILRIYLGKFREDGGNLMKSVFLFFILKPIVMDLTPMDL